MEEMVRQVKQNTTHNHTKGWSSFKEKSAVYMVGLDGSPLLCTPSRKTNGSSMYCFQLHQLKVAFHEKPLELIRKCIIFYQDIASLHVSLICVLSHFSHVRFIVAPWTIACQAPLSMEFSRQEYCNGLLCPLPGESS